MSVQRFTEAMYIELHQLWDVDGLSSSECADVLRGHYKDYPGVITRSGICGVIQRARAKPQYAGWFTTRERRSVGPRAPRVRVRTTSHLPKRSILTGRPIPTPPHAVEAGQRRLQEAEVAFLPFAPPIAFMALEDKHCRWPVEGGYCGCDRIPGKKPYCRKHARL